MRLSFGFSLLSLTLPLAAWAEPHAKAHLNRHHDLAKRASGDMHIYKRFSASRWSYYFVDVAAGACGVRNSDSSFTVALNTPQYGSGYPGPNCFKTITMKYNGKTTTATIMDQCPGCPYGGLDLSPGLFEFFAPHSAGIIYGEWYFNDGAPAPEPETPKPATTKKTKTPTPTPEPTSTYVWVPPTTTSTKTKTSSTSTTPASTSIWSEPSSAAPSSLASSSALPSASVASVDYASGAASGLAVPTGVVESSTTEKPQNILALNHLFINMGGLVVGAAGAR
ncbi:RlpA-like double-psi beta-barrel-protein domain-containing protein-containing protein [Crucibulum laeve]|uniref:RlpA-like double-psi beta-barrel-protein domain-containing protein-containing protein n=1 Tax=Crucibulum laeve TaxID=68775 RepID=A0A5C3MKL0_9AGAR|nr:RlpA-like double-psi beta-barrel-protein domain-containing protein-containing protein [Crucibulum laeve]